MAERRVIPLKAFSEDIFSQVTPWSTVALDEPVSEPGRDLETLRSIELFGGAGGLALGLASAGFRHLALLANNSDAVATVRENRCRIPAMRDWPDVVTLDVRDVESALKSYNEVDLLAAAAPSQPFSLAGKHRGHVDERNLFPSVLKALRYITPRAVIIENVRGLLRPGFLRYVDYVRSQLAIPEVVANLGETWIEHGERLNKHLRERARQCLRYHVTTHVLNAADFGTPQRRTRVFIIALRQDLAVTELRVRQTHSKDALSHDQWVSGEYWHRHPGLHRRGAMPEPSESGLRQLKRTDRRDLPPAWRTVRDALKDLPVPLPFTPNDRFHNHEARPGARSYPGHTGSPFDQPAKAIKAGTHGVPGGENMLIQDDDSVRYFTIREAARLQDFPDEMIFSGSWGQCLRQIGNAVPVRLARAVATSVADVLKRS